MVTLETHKNLKNTINEMDNEIAQFAKQYDQEQAQITAEINKIVETLITPIAIENIKLRQE